MCTPPLSMVFILISIIIIIILVDSVIKQHTIGELLNKVNLGMISSQMADNEENRNGELYRDLPNGTKLILENGNTIITPPNSRLVETRNDIILQMANGDLFIVPDGTTISIPQNQQYVDPAQTAMVTIKAAEESVAPPAAEAAKDTFVGRRENFNNDLDAEAKIDTLTDDYTADLLNLGLEKSVRDQHKAYSKERNRVTNTASSTSVRDDNQDIVPWVGLSRPNYAGVHFDAGTARNLPSTVSVDDLPPSGGARRFFGKQ